MASSDFESDLYHQNLFEASRGIILSLADSAITATRTYNDDAAHYGPKFVKLGALAEPSCSQCFLCVNPLQNDYLTIDLGTSRIVTGIEIAGRGTENTNQMVTKFDVKT